ncbi:MAG: hypothetical protein RXR20_21150 [Paraburkholderia sp.]|jgi:hypothetical protein|uniref:hypothetical protein n=1 Tax=Burkholderiaceae TaxID=119060 RepID=UPI0010F7FAE7|nr:hypothetical protein [Burkholderia sp. 4M9327F10]
MVITLQGKGTGMSHAEDKVIQQPAPRRPAQAIDKTQFFWHTSNRGAEKFSPLQQRPAIRFAFFPLSISKLII